MQKVTNPPAGNIQMGGFANLEEESLLLRLQTYPTSVGPEDEEPEMRYAAYCTLCLFATTKTRL